MKEELQSLEMAPLASKRINRPPPINSQPVNASLPALVADVAMEEFGVFISIYDPWYATFESPESYAYQFYTPVFQNPKAYVNNSVTQVTSRCSFWKLMSHHLFHALSETLLGAKSSLDNVMAPLRQTRINFKPLRQIRVGQEKPPKRNQVCLTISHDVDGIISLITSGANKRPFKSFLHRKSTVWSFVMCINFHHSWLNYMEIKDLVLVKCICHIKPKSFRVRIFAFHKLIDNVSVCPMDLDAIKSWKFKGLRCYEMLSKESNIVDETAYPWAVLETPVASVTRRPPSVALCE
ncbi:hypothetical protein LXL04_038813 [Taraxacum kok-saghyz]